LHYIEAEAQDVVTLYRSTGTVMLAQGGRGRQPCEAFVCAVQNGAAVNVYVALSLQNSKNLVIFAPKELPDTKKSHEDLVSAALATVKDWGFEMEGVNLNYSKALKEVVLNDLRIVRQPQSARKSGQKRGAGERHARPSSQVQGKGGQTEVSHDTKSTEETPASLRTPDGKATGKGHGGGERGKTDKESAGTGRGESVPDQAGRHETPIPGAVEHHGTLMESVLQPTKGPSDAAVEKKQELASLEAEMERISREKSVAVSKLNNDLENTRKEIARVGEEKARMQREASQQIDRLRSELETLSSEKRDVEEALSREIATLGSEIEKVIKDKKSLEKDAAEEVATLKAELERLSNTRSEDEKMRAGEVAALRSELEGLSTAEADVELDGLRVELERLKAERDLARSATETEKSAIREEIERIRKENRKNKEKSVEELLVLKLDFRLSRSLKKSASAQKKCLT